MGGQELNIKTEISFCNENEHQNVNERNETEPNQTKPKKKLSDKNYKRMLV